MTDKAKVFAKLSNVRHSPRKMRVTLVGIRGLPANRALERLDISTKKAATYIRKLLRSAVANAENNFKYQSDNLVIEEIQVGEGRRLKRPKYRARGRVDMAKSRYSHVKVVLVEKIKAQSAKSKATD